LLNTIRERFKYFSKRKVAPQDLNQIQIDLLEESTLNLNYLVLILGSCVIATFGLLSNSAFCRVSIRVIFPFGKAELTKAPRKDCRLARLLGV
jgi:hypothetical protein